MGNRLRVVILATYLYNVEEFSSAWYGQERLNSVVADRHEGTLQLQLISGAASLRLTRLKKVLRSPPISQQFLQMRLY